MKITKTTLQMASIGLFSSLIIASCGGNEKSSDNTNSTETSENFVQERQTKMNKYVDAINKITSPLQKGYNFYLNYVNKETGEKLNPDGEVYFSILLEGSDKILSDLELASKESPAEPIDKFAVEYVKKAKALIVLHNELANYYRSKGNLVDNNAKGLAKHKPYITAAENFKVIAKSLSDSNKKYYKETNEAYIAKLEKEGDKVRVAANKLMNEAELFNDAFYDAIPLEGKVEMTSELESVLKKSIVLENKINAFTTAYKSITPEEEKKFFRSTAFFSSYESDANGLLTSARTCIANIKKANEDPSIDRYINEVGGKYSDMIQSFNTSGF